MNLRRFIFAIMLILPFVLTAEIPRTMNYSSRLTDSDGNAVDLPSKTIAFLIYETSTDGTPAWAETLNVAVVDGYIDIQLGEVHEMAIPFRGPYWLELIIDSDDDGDIDITDEILTPREKLAPVAFSHRAVYADTADNYEETQNLADVLAEGNDAEGTIITGLPSPTGSSDAANKAYVDASDGTTASSTYCIYIHNTSSCPSGWREEGDNIGPYFEGAYKTRVCCKSNEDNSMNYFVLTSSTHNGDFNGYGGSTSGLEGANLWCLEQLRTYYWAGKENLDSLTATNVKAFLCDSDSCNNLEPNSYYTYAYGNGDDYGGAVFQTDGYGRGPKDTYYWSRTTRFGVSDTDYWTNRSNSESFPQSRWGTEPLESTINLNCLNWSSSSSSYTGVYGKTSSDTFSRWNYYIPDNCDQTNHLICIVNK